MPWQVIFQQITKFFFYLFEVRFIYPKGIIRIKSNYFNVHLQKILIYKSKQSDPFFWLRSFNFLQYSSIQTV